MGMRAEERVYPNNVQYECVYPWRVLRNETDPVEVTLGPDPSDKAEAWKGDRTPDGSIVSGPGMSLAGFQCHLALSRPPQRKGSGVSRPLVGPPRSLGPDQS